jgi:hypothetical protein
MARRDAPVSTIGASIGFLLTEVGLRLLGLRRTAMLAARLRRRPRQNAGDGSIADIVATVDRVADYVPVRSDCLRRVMVAQHQLLRRGVETDVVLGVCLVNRQVAAHAWLERLGVPLGIDPTVPMGYREIARVTPGGELRRPAHQHSSAEVGHSRR